MPVSIYRWVLVAAGGFMGCVAMGAMFSLPVFLSVITKDTGWSVTGISTSMTIGFLAMAFASLGWGNLSDRIGPRPVLLIGTSLLAASLALASLAPGLLMFQASFGVMAGCAAAAIIPPLMASITGWFDSHRSLAVSLVSAGMGMAPLTMAPLAAYLVTIHDWRTSLQVLALIVAVTTVPLALIFRRAPLVAQEAGAVHSTGEQRPTASSVLRSPQFIILFLTNFCCCATHSGPIFHTVSYAITCGIPMMAAVTIYSVEGLAGMGGRIAFGLLGDKFGAKPVLVAGLLAQALGALAYVLAGNLAAFYTVAATFGFIYAGIMPLYSVIVRENFPPSMMGTVIGGTAMAGSLGMATGPFAGGLIYDTLATYTWLYVGSFAIGIGAFLIMMTFKPVHRPLLSNEIAATL